MRNEYLKQDEIREHAIETLKELKDSNIYACDLHNEIFNMEYYIIGTYNTKEWLGSDVFEAIEVIREYEQDNFGEVNTDFSDAEKVVNMYVYIVGESVLNESETLREKWNNILSDEDIDKIIEELS